MRSSLPDNPPRVAILLSTYDGARFLPEQLASFDAQDHRAWRLFWRDDGSTDETRAVMARWSAGRNDVLALADSFTRRGVLDSFLTLLRAAVADPDCDLFAFADQDDVWLPQKLSRAVAAIGDSPVPTLYCARQTLVDGALRPIAPSAPVRILPGFPTALTQNIATGCTIVMNRAAASLVASSAPPSETVHDWWSYLLVAATGGRIIADPEPVVFYRQHAANVIGAPSSRVVRALAAARRGPGAFMRIFRAHLDALSAVADQLTPEARSDVAAFSRALAGPRRNRLAALFRHGLRRQTPTETLVFRLWFMLG
jgi:glycosyltransferase involved in cell wall biosynthesis